MMASPATARLSESVRQAWMSEQMFLSADLSGFTALTEVQGNEPAADLAGAFFEDARVRVAAHGAREVKTVGDAMMIRCTSVASAIGSALAPVRELGAGHGLPSVRVGMHTGPAVDRDGDWYGADGKPGRARVRRGRRGARCL